MHERIAKIIDITGMKKIDFAKRLGISAPFVSELCAGVKKPSDRTITDICREFDVNEEWLRTGEGEMFKQTEEDAASRLCAEMHTSELEAGIIRAYFRIDPKIRDAFMSCLIEEVQTEYSAVPAFAPALAPTAEEEARAEAEEFYRQIFAEKEQEAKSRVSQSDTGGSTPKMA